MIHGEFFQWNLSFGVKIDFLNTGQTRKCIVTEIKSGRQKQCQFPFIWKGLKNYGCTTVDGGGKSWCSTKVISETFQHDENHSYYGDCNENNHACFNSGPGNVHYNHLKNYFNHHVCLSLWHVSISLSHLTVLSYSKAKRPSQTSAGKE